MKKLFSRLVLIFLLSYSINGIAQDRISEIETKLKELSKESLGLNEKVDLSVSGVSISDFIRGLATSNNLNISIDPGLNTKVVNNFTNVPVIDVLIFLCKKYDLDIGFTGNIMSISQYVSKPIPKPSKALKISYDKVNNFISLDLANDSLQAVAKEITRISQKNVLIASDLNGKIVNGFIQDSPFNTALDKLAFTNDLKLTPTTDNFYLFEKNVNPSQFGSRPQGNNFTSNYNQANGFTLKVESDSLITVEAINAPISEILSAASKQMKCSYFLYTEPKGNTSFRVENSTFEDFLNLLFNSTDYSFKKSGKIYLIGDRNLEGVRSTKVVTLKYRTIDKIDEVIPADLKKGIEIKPFRDLNSLILSGSQPRIEEVEAFLRDIDRVVPNISIEVMVIDVRNSHTVSSGIKAGLGKSPTPTGGDVFPELNLNLGAGAINSIIDGINGTGIVNLGKVTPNFYLSLQLMEANGDLEIRSTPLLATLNGNEATMGFNETKYYLENTSSIIQTTNTTTVASQSFKPLPADFSMTINPIVSGDDQITLDISFKKQSFTEQTGGKTGPYGTASRDFKSLIRVKNQDMIMLGGLEDITKDESSSGVPVLSRIPVIKWFFSSRTKKKSKSKLTIFIKPTVIY